MPESAEDLPIALGLPGAQVHELGGGSSDASPLPDSDGARATLWIDLHEGPGPAQGSADSILLLPLPRDERPKPGAGSVETTFDLGQLRAQLAEREKSDPPAESSTGSNSPELRIRPVDAPGGSPKGVLRSELESVSEGAYISWQQYRESLSGRWRFAADRCPQCSQLTFPARGRCRQCGNSLTLERIELPRSGRTVEAITTVHAGAQPTEFDPQVEQAGSYDVAILRLAPGAMATAQVTDVAPGTLHVGDPVDTCLRRLYPMEGKWRYGRKARPMQPVPKGT